MRDSVEEDSFIDEVPEDPCIDEDPYAEMDRLRALTSNSGDTQSRHSSFRLGPVADRPAQPPRTAPAALEVAGTGPFTAESQLDGQAGSAPVRRRIWDIEDDSSACIAPVPTSPLSQSPGATPLPNYPGPQPAAWPRPEARVSEEVRLARAQIALITDAGRASVPTGAPADAARAKTRLLGFQTADFEARDPLAGPHAAAPGSVPRFPVGWIVVVDGPGRGASFTLLNGVSSIGRGEDQAIRLDFGDISISRQNHASIAFDDEVNRFFLGHGGKSNIVRLNGRPVLSTEDLAGGDTIRIGETTLQFIAFCGEDFSWDGTGEDAEDDDGATR
ncbi:FHA domain-containing protein [Tropicimonas sp. IMCC6043]|uniref:FHA domain-containing protein n=1 Tax=Tropicimonas sp. IMCC6043 TaxID=2510645 RepID=UPI001F5C33C7|nr:FHA domain-containing protein [Tropicimonas sp. IMCC6043]